MIVTFLQSAHEGLGLLKCVQVGSVLGENAFDHRKLVGDQSLLINNWLRTAHKVGVVPPWNGFIEEYLVCLRHRSVHVKTICVCNFDIILVTEKSKRAANIYNFFLASPLLDISFNQLTQARHNGIVGDTAVVTDELGCSIEIAV